MTASSRDLRIEDVSAGYGRRRVLHRVSLDPLVPGSISAIVGPNGAGKSTLLRVLAGLIPAEGRVVFGGEDLLAATPEMRAHHIGFMPQRLPSGIGLCVLEGVIGALKVAGGAGTGRQVRERAAAVLQRLGITALAMEPLDRLSGGQRQMASLAQALASGPSLLLLDEPTSALDLRHQFHVMRAIRGLADEGRIVIVVLHDLALAAQWADRIVVLRQGALHADGRPDATITPAMLADVYGVAARVERSFPGRLHIATDGLAGEGDALTTHSMENGPK